MTPRVRRWRYFVALPLMGEVEAETRAEAERAAIEDAREALDWNGEWWGAADVSLQEVTPDARDTEARA